MAASPSVVTSSGASSATRCTSGPAARAGAPAGSRRRRTARRRVRRRRSRLGAAQGIDQGGFERDSAVGEVSGVLGLGVDADRPAEARRQPGPQVEDLGERRHGEAPVEAGVAGPQRRQAFAGPQRAQLDEGEVVDEPPGARVAVDDAGGVPVGELGALRDVGGAAELGLVPGHQHAVSGRDEVGFEEVGAELGGQDVGDEGVLRAVGRSAAVADDERVARSHGSESGCPTLHDVDGPASIR